MINFVFKEQVETPTPVYKEGDLYKIIKVHGQTFELYYGYYEQCERDNPSIEPMPVYPDFIKHPQYTEDGFLFVTKMQDACEHYKGQSTEFNECADCQYYNHGDELLGVCVCPKNRKDKTQQEKATPTTEVIK